MFWNRNMLLTDIMRTSGSLLMTFWKIFDGRMIFSWNFMTFRSGHRILVQKSSEVTRMCPKYPLTSYFGLITIWWLFVAKSWFLWSMLTINEKVNLLTFFLFKEKNHPTLGSTRTAYTWNFFKIWVWRIISMFWRFRSTYRIISYLHTEGTEIWNIRHKNPFFHCKSAMMPLHQFLWKMMIFSKIFFSRKSSKFFLSNALFRFS